jgi:hypothetical protein
VSAAAAARHARGAAGKWQWELLVPPGWWRLPVEPAAARAAVRELLDRRLAGRPRDEVAPLRISLDRQLRAALRQARDAGAEQVWTQVELIRGLPVSAALTVARVPLPSADVVAELHPLLAGGEHVVESGRAQLAGLPAMRRRRRWVGPVLDAEDAPPVPHTAVDWVLALPDDDDLLVLSFSTLSEPVVEQLVAVFDAVAATLQLHA